MQKKPFSLTALMVACSIFASDPGSTAVSGAKWLPKGNVSVTVIPSEHKSSEALRIADASAARGFASAVRQEIQQGKTYEFSGFLKSADGKPHSTKLMVAVYNAEGKMFNWIGIAIIKTGNEWTPFRIILKPDMLKNVASMAPAIFPEDKASDTGAVLADGLKFGVREPQKVPVVIKKMKEQNSLLDILWSGDGGKSGWVQMPSGKKVQICKDEEYHHQKIFTFSVADGSVAMSEKSFVIHPGKKYTFDGMIRSTVLLSENAGEKDLALMAAKLGNSGVFDASIEIVLMDRNGNMTTLAQESCRFQSIWKSFHILFSLPESATSPVEAKAVIKIFKKSGSFQTTKLRIREGFSKTVSIAEFINRPYKNTLKVPGWTGDADHDVRNFKGGKRRVAEILFDIPESGAIGLSQRPGFHRSVEIPLENVNSVYIFNTAAWAPKNAHVGTLRWNYTDGTSVSEKFISGLQTGDWFNVRMQKTLRSYMVEQFGVCPVARSVQFFVSPVANLYSRKKVKSITLEASAAPEPVWLVMGVSCGFGGNIAGVQDTQVTLNIDRSSWVPFDMRVRKTSGKPLVDFRNFLDAPAGKHGFLQTKDGHFVFSDGTPARFIGTELGETGRYPTHEEAEAIADTMARYGINIVRMRQPPANAKYIEDKHLFPKDADLIDRFDYFFYCLKQRGIYIVSDLAYGCTKERYRDAGGFPGLDAYFPQNRPWHYYDGKIQKLWLQFINEDFSRVNPYTKLSYFDDPAIALVLCFNESGLLWDYRTDRGTPEYYKTLLRKLFSGFLKEKYSSREDVVKKWGNGNGALSPEETFEKENITPVWNWELTKIGSNPSGRERDSVRFYFSLQKKFNTETLVKLRNLGLRVPIASTNAGRTPENMEYTAQNSYYDHNKWIPKFNADGKFCGAYWETSNIPETLVNPMTGLTLQAGIARAKITGLPHTSTENDIMWPQEWRSMHMFNLVASGSLQNWDMLIQFAFMGNNHHSWTQVGALANIFNPTAEYNDPAMFGVFPAMAAAWHRNDIAPGKNLIQLIFSPSSVERLFSFRSYDFPHNLATWLCRIEQNYGTPTSDASVVIEEKRNAGKTYLSFPARPSDFSDHQDSLARKLDAEMKKNRLLEPGRGLQNGRIVSDTGEITRDWLRGITVINSPRTQGVTGSVPSEGILFPFADFQTKNGFCTVVFTSLDGQPLEKSKRVFLTMVARAGNSQDRVSYKRSEKMPNGFKYGIDMRLEQIRKGCVLAEPVVASLRLKNTKRAVLTPLAPDMTAAAKPMEFRMEKHELTVRIGEQSPSPWYLLELERGEGDLSK